MATEYDLGLVIGPQGKDGPPGEGGGIGPQGVPGAAATVGVGSVTSVPYGQPAAVVNAGTSTAAVLQFTIPEGREGKSAHKLAVEGGYSGTEAELSATLNCIPTAEQQATWTAKETTAGAQAKADAARDAAKAASVPTSRKVNNKALTGDIVLTATDVGARSSTWTPTAADVGAVKSSSVSDIQIVASFPATPTSGVLYIVLE